MPPSHDDMKGLRMAPGLLPSVTGVPSSSSRLALDVGVPINSHASNVWRYENASRVITIRVVTTDKVQKDVPHILPMSGENPTDAVLAVPSPKESPRSYSAALGILVNFVRHHLAQEAVILRPGTRRSLDTAIRIHCKTLTTSNEPEAEEESTATLSDLVDARKIIIPLALVLLCAIPELACDDPADATDRSEPVTKADIADRLHSLVARWPDGNPPRAALKRVNEYLMSRSMHEVM